MVRASDSRDVSVGDGRPKADHAGAFKQLPLRENAVVILRKPTDGRFYGFFPENPAVRIGSGSTALRMSFKNYGHTGASGAQAPMCEILQRFGLLAQFELIRNAMRPQRSSTKLFTFGRRRKNPKRAAHFESRFVSESRDAAK